MASQQPYYNASNPVVVQGVWVDNHHQNNANNANAGNSVTGRVYDPKHVMHGVGAMESEIPPHRSSLYVSNTDEMGHWTRGEAQPARCNDAPFGILFYAHLGAMAWVAAAFAPRMLSEVAESAMNAGDDNGGGGGRDLVEGDASGAVGGGGGVGSRLLTRMVEGTHRVMSVTLSNYHGRVLQEDGEAEIQGTTDINDMLILLGISSLIALVVSTFALSIMIRHAQFLIKFALLFNIVATAVFAIGSMFLSPFAAISGLFLFALTVYYAYVVWGRIPFAACNLVTATTAVKSNLGLAFFAYSSLFVMIGWSAWWIVSFVSTVYVTSECDGQANCQKEPNGIIVFLLMLSYHWTFQVIRNVVHVTVAGTVGTWWFVPTEGSSCCSKGVRDSFMRSVTSSFGSICMGSLLVAIVETAKTMVKNLRESEDGGGIFLCIAECLLACLQDMLEYFNSWAFVFVGLYGYTFIESGKNVINLFKTRGWTTIITDNLAQGVLGMVSAAVGLITGLVALGIAHSQGMVFGDQVGADSVAFFVGFIIGTVLTSTLLTLVSSAVNTVIVCYAEAPQEFQQNHPKLSEDMRAAWRLAWPVEFTY